MLSKSAEKDRARAEVWRLADEKRRRFLRVTPDCGEVEWAGVPYEFDESQRKVVARLWAVREDDEPFAHERTLLALSGLKLFALRDVFKGHPAWGHRGGARAGVGQEGGQLHARGHPRGVVSKRR